MRTFAAALVWGIPPLMFILALCLPLEWAAYELGAMPVVFYTLHKFGGWADRRWPSR